MDKHIIQYDILWSVSTQDLIASINKAIINEGWQPYGPPYVKNYKTYQPIVKYGVRRNYKKSKEEMV